MGTQARRCRAPSDDECAEYHRDGVVLLRGLFDASWIELLNHGLDAQMAAGQLDEDADLRVFTTKWLGDDVRVAFRECGMDPDHSVAMTAHGLRPGDRPGTELYPKVWERQAG